MLAKLVGIDNEPTLSTIYSYTSVFTMLISSLCGFLTCGYLIKKKDGLNNTNTYMNIILILMNNVFTISYIVQHVAKLSYGTENINIEVFEQEDYKPLYYIYLVSSLIGLSSVLVQYLWMPYISYVGLNNLLNSDMSKSKKSSLTNINKVLLLFTTLTLFIVLLCNYLNNWIIYTRSGFFYTCLYYIIYFYSIYYY